MSNGTWGLSKRAHGGTLTRFINPPKHEPTPRSDAALAVDHAALTEARTVYPSRVFAPSERERVLISGHSNAKIGTAVTKGPWKGFRIYTLSLEERATCPSSCANWDTCYGNAMGMAVRFKHGPDLIRALDRDLAALQREHPRGFVVRLHVLGDFYDMPYLAHWWRYMETFKALHVWGYTAHAADSAIGIQIGTMNNRWPGRWSIRTSVAAETGTAPMQASTAWTMDEIGDGIVCPAETGKTPTCGTCGLCWASAAAEKRIVFLGHGKTAKGSRQPGVREDRTPEPEAPPMPPPAAPAPTDFVAYLKQGRDAYAALVTAMDALIAFHQRPAPVLPVLPVMRPPAVVEPVAPATAPPAVSEVTAPVAPAPAVALNTRGKPRKNNLRPETLERLRAHAAAMRARRAAKNARPQVDIREDTPTQQLTSEPAVEPAKIETPPAEEITPPVAADPVQTAPEYSNPIPPLPEPEPVRKDSLLPAPVEPRAPLPSRMSPKDFAAVRQQQRAAVSASPAPSKPAAPQPQSRMEALMMVSRSIQPRKQAAPSDDDVAAWIAKNGVTKLPAAAVAETTADIPDEDKAAVKAHQDKMFEEWAAAGGGSWRNRKNRGTFA